MLVAIASSDGSLVDGHFARTDKFYIYQVDTKGHQLTDIVEMQEGQQSTKSLEDGHDNKIFKRIERLKECQLLLVAAIGKSAVDKVIANQIYPLRIETKEKIEELLCRLEELMRENPPLWLQKIIYKSGR